MIDLILLELQMIILILIHYILFESIGNVGRTHEGFPETKKN